MYLTKFVKAEKIEDIVEGDFFKSYRNLVILNLTKKEYDDKTINLMKFYANYDENNIYFLIDDENLSKDVNFLLQKLGVELDDIDNFDYISALKLDSLKSEKPIINISSLESNNINNSSLALSVLKELRKDFFKNEKFDKSIGILKNNIPGVFKLLKLLYMV